MSKGSCALLLSAGLAVGAGLLSTALAQELQRGDTQQPQQPQQSQPQTEPQQSQQQPPQRQPPTHQQAQPPDLQQIWQMQRAQTRARIAGAVQQLRTACQEELRNFCGTVTPGEGRLLLCMQAHEDKIGRQCELALLETSRNIGKAVRHMDNLAQACWQDIQTHCTVAGGSVVQCMIDNRQSLSSRCQAMVAALMPPPGQAQAPQPQDSMVGIVIYSADGMMLGEVTGVKRRADGSLEAIEADIGSPMGMGATSVLISPGDLRWRGDGVELQMMVEQVRSVLQGQRR